MIRIDSFASHPASQRPPAPSRRSEEVDQFQPSPLPPRLIPRSLLSMGTALFVAGVGCMVNLPSVGEASATPRSESSQSESLPSVQRKSVDSFVFSSEPLHPQSIRDLILRNQRAGKVTMVGIDPNNQAEQQAKVLRVARENGARTHKYLEGRGGPTGTERNASWDESEWQRTQALASLEKIPLTVPDDQSPAMRAWNDKGWQRAALRQAREARREGFDSVEIDNINRDLQGQDNSDEAKLPHSLEFFQKYALEYRKGDMPTLMLKNLTLLELEAVESGLKNRFPREMFSDFAINEYDASLKPGKERDEMMADLVAREKVLRRLGICPLRSGDTHRYAASGTCGN